MRGALFCLFVLALAGFGQYHGKTSIAHRGASAYAPENTLPAYRLAMEQGADYVEQDLQITKDGILVCLHDLTLERTTDVQRLFPDRYTTEERGGKAVRHWYVSDFTLAEIKRLDAGSWMDKKFKGTTIPTWQEAIDEIRGKAGLYPETKAPEVYGSRGFDMEKLVLDQLRKNGLDKPNAEPKTPVIIQSFSEASLRKMGEMGCRLPRLFLFGERDKQKWLSRQAIQRVKEFAVGIGPEKTIVRANPEIVQWAHDAGLSVTVYTLSSADPGGFPEVAQEAAFYLYKLGVDALFINNPDRFPRRPM
jgi:glycerophosphoryl diester phosphodiesterase